MVSKHRVEATFEKRKTNRFIPFRIPLRVRDLSFDSNRALVGFRNDTYAGMVIVVTHVDGTRVKWCGGDDGTVRKTNRVRPNVGTTRILSAALGRKPITNDVRNPSSVACKVVQRHYDGSMTDGERA